ncbi:MAG: hypothetical protein AB1344_02570 [Pseudomonadota bacterium]
MHRVVLALLLGLIAPSALAYTEVDMLDRKGKPTTIVIEDGWARGATYRSDYTYTLMDLRTPRLYLIDMGERTVSDVSDVFLKGKRIEYGLTRIGPGPEVAGRPTVEYKVSDIDDEDCARIFLWPTPPEQDLLELQNLFAQVRVFPEALLPFLGPLAQGLMSSCVRAELDALGELSRKGLIAMRVNYKGETTLRISEVRHEGSIPACMMKLPGHYQQESPPTLALKLLKRRLFGGREKPPEPLTLSCP